MEHDWDPRKSWNIPKQISLGQPCSPQMSSVWWLTSQEVLGYPRMVKPRKTCDLWMSWVRARHIGLKGMSMAIPDTYVRCKSNDNNNIINVCLNNTVLIYHKLITIYTTATSTPSILRHLMSFLLQLMEMEYYILNGRYLAKDITWCNLHSHGRFSQARSHIQRGIQHPMQYCPFKTLC